MRVLVTCLPQTGHLLPLLPLAEALRARGDEVLVAGGPEVGEAVAGRGLPFRPAGPPFGRWFEALASRTRGVPGDGLPPDRVERYFVPRLFGEIGCALVVDDLLAVARDVRPDVILFDGFAYAAPLVAVLVGARPVQQVVGLLPATETLDLVTDAVSPIWREFGLTVPPAAGTQAGTSVTVCPPSLDPAAARLPTVQPMRPVPLPHDGPPPADLPAWLWERPMVYVTLGTFSNSNLPLFRLLLDAAAGLPVTVLATVGSDVDPAELGTLPGSVHVTSFVPQADVLGHCAAVVHHAGAGTSFGVLAHALPAVALPQSADNFAIAQRLAEAGAARVLMPDQVTPDAVQAALAEALSGGDLRVGAEKLAREIAEMPSPAAVAATLGR